jgi:hypothetical protein
MTDIDAIVPSQSFFYENAFYLTAHPSRIAKLLTQYELFKVASRVPGDIVECGVFKGASLCRFARFRNIVQGSCHRKLIGFDIFGTFPKAGTGGKKGDAVFRERFVRESGEKSISRRKLMGFLRRCGLAEGVELIAGDVSKTVPAYAAANPGLRIALLNLDVDLYNPTRDCLATLYDRVVSGGVIIFDDYKGFPGATKAIDEFFSGKTGITIKKMEWSRSPFF